MALCDKHKPSESGIYVREAPESAAVLISGCQRSTANLGLYSTNVQTEPRLAAGG